MLGWFKSPTFDDPQLGPLTRTGGCWRGSIALAAAPGGPVPLAVSGPRTEPDTEALSAAKALIADFATLRREMEAALFEHYGPYADATGTDGTPTALRIESPADVWPHVSLAFVSIVPLDGQLTTELGYNAAWDDEHMLGVRFRSGVFLELCGSVLPP